jgi:hypothetical protein
MSLVLLRAMFVGLLISLWHPSGAMADVVIAGTFDNLYAQVSSATAKDLIARLVEVLGIPIKYEGMGDRTIDGSRRGSLIYVLSQYFPQHLIVVRRTAGRILEVIITESSDDGRAIAFSPPTPQQSPQPTGILIPLHLIKGRGY